MNDKLESREREKEVAAMFKKFIPASFSATLLRIGKFSSEPLNEGNLKARCYFDKRKLVWAISDKSKNINKIEVMWDNISAIRALAEENNPGILEIELIKEPTFHREIYLGPRIHPRFELSEDFTDGHASIYRRHYLVFPPGVLGKHYEKLLQSDNRLLELSRRPFPFFESPYFGPPLLYDIDEGSMDKSHVYDLIDYPCDSSSTTSSRAICPYMYRNTTIVSGLSNSINTRSMHNGVPFSDPNSQAPQYCIPLVQPANGNLETHLLHKSQSTILRWSSMS